MTPVTLPDDRQGARGRGISPDRRRFSRALLASGLFHGAALAILVALWEPAPPKEAPPAIPVTLAGPEGVSGARGGGQNPKAASAPGGMRDTGVAASAPQPEDNFRQRNEAAPFPAGMPARRSKVAAVIAAKPPPAISRTIEPVPPPKPNPPPTQPAARAPLKPPVPAPAPPPTKLVQPHPASPAPSAPVPSYATASSSTASSLAPGSNATSTAGGIGHAAEGSGRSAAGNGSLQGPGDNYLDEVERWVARFRQYPDKAIKDRQEGVVTIGFKFARDGKVLDAWIEKSSGYALLDKAALQMIHDASPLPPVPARYKGNTLTLVMPERFRIGLFDRLFN